MCLVQCLVQRELNEIFVYKLFLFFSYVVPIISSTMHGKNKSLLLLVNRTTFLGKYCVDEPNTR